MACYLQERLGHGEGSRRPFRPELEKNRESERLGGAGSAPGMCWVRKRVAEMVGSSIWPERSYAGRMGRWSFVGCFGRRGKVARGRPRGELKRTRRWSLRHPRRAVTRPASSYVAVGRARGSARSAATQDRGARDPHRITVASSIQPNLLFCKIRPNFELKTKFHQNKSYSEFYKLQNFFW